MILPQSRSIAAQIKEPIRVRSPPVTRPHTTNNLSLSYEKLSDYFSRDKEATNSLEGEETGKKGEEIERNREIL